MDVTASDVPPSLESVEMTSVGEDKRDREENGDRMEESAAPPLKKPRFDEGVNRVAEIVLVLSAMRTIRGGKSPTELELELMVEAKSKLTDMCQEFNPKDIIGRDAIGAVIEDLGLNGKLKDQRLGFRAPKLTISEKLSLGKRKMEESKKHPIVSTSYTSPVHSATTNNVSMTHQWPNSDLKASASSVNATGSHFVRDASGITQSRMERPQFKPDMHISATQGPAVTTGNYFGNATPWSTQTHSSSTISFGTPSDSKVAVQSSSRVTDPSFRPFMSQTPPATTFQGVKGVNYGQTSSPFGNNHHAEIAKIIHKVLQPRAKQNISWNPPSREYMSRAILCQMCQGTINEVDTVLICDACEKGCHLKCLQANNLKGVPKSEWHCSRCVQLYNGKPFPPKYGRVMRSAATSKMSSGASEVQLPEKKVGKTNVKVNQEAMPHPETAKPTEDATAMNQTVESEDAAAMNQTVEAEDAAAMKQAVEAEDAAANAATMNQTVEAEDAAANAASMNQTVEAEDAAANAAAMNQTVEAEDAAAMNQTVEAEAEDAATNQTVESENAAAMNQTVESEDAAAMYQTVEAEDAAAMNQTVEAEDAAAMNQIVEAEDAAAMNQTVEAEDAAAMNQTVKAEAEDAATNQTVESEDAATNQTVEAEDADTNQAVEAEDAAMNQTVDTNNESQGPIGNDTESGDPSEPVADSETLNPPKLENGEDPSNDVTEISVSENCQDKNSEPSLQEGNSASQTENSLSESPLQSNTDHSQEQDQDTTPNVEENPKEDKSC